MCGRGWRMAGLWLVASVCVGGAALVGCGSPQAGASRGSEESPNASDAEVVGTPVFGLVAATVAPMPVYGPAYLPSGALVPGEWWPVVDVGEPAAYEGPAIVNPRILGGHGYDPEVQVVVEVGGGWLAILENFRGDLGDVTGVFVGMVAGHEAWLYSVNGGELVQWSDGGRWYGVFGRAVPAETVVRVALEMRVVLVDGESQ